jgi:myo-inositol-1(or 4)-monophosphatase
MCMTHTLYARLPAGVIIAREAGAVVVDADGSSHTVNSTATIASARPLVGQALDVVRAARAEVHTIL